MKRIALVMASAMVFAACGGGASKQETPKTTTSETPATADLSDNPDYKAGLALIGGSDCLTCHKVDEKLNGPAYRDVANKYAGAPDTIVQHLAGKIIKGGNGVWGEIMMTPHPSLSEADAEAMVKYVLLLKK